MVTPAGWSTAHKCVSATLISWCRACIVAARSPQKIGLYTQSLTVFVEDVDAHYRRAKSEGAKIVEDLNETCYGERQYGVEDLGGHHWLFTQHAKDVSPDEWGATIAGR